MGSCVEWVVVSWVLIWSCFVSGGCIGGWVDFGVGGVVGVCCVW